MESKIVTINSRKFDNSIHRTWKAEILESSESLLKFAGEFEKEIDHPHLGIIRPATVSYEFYWYDRWYNIFRFHEPSGELRNFYCNINMPPTFADGILDYVDLDIDIVVWRDFSFRILDSDEFEENARRFSYPNDLRKKVETAQSELLSSIENKSFPFDYRF